MNVSGDELRVGDTIAVWWKPNRDTITELRPYDGPHKSIGCIAVAMFALLPSGGMTIWSNQSYTVLNREKQA